MIKAFRKSRFLKIVSITMAVLFINEIIFPTVAMALTGGPSQPEVESFAPIEATDMVDLFSGDFKYNIPLMDVDGYPININYNSNITMDQEASWVGLGWNLNPGVINRSMRGLPDEFCGDVVTKEFNFKEDISIGVKGYLRDEFFSKGLSASMGYTLNYSTKFGFSLEQNIGLTKSTAIKTSGQLTYGLNLNRSTKSGTTITPNASFSIDVSKKGEIDNKLRLGMNLGFPINSICGLKTVQLGLSATQTANKITKSKNEKEATKKSYQVGSASGSSSIGWGKEAYTPQITMPIQNLCVDVNVNIGKTIFTADGFIGIGANYSKQSLAANVVNKPAYGYMYSNVGYQLDDALLDFNRENDVTYYEGIPVLSMSNKTYDSYSISGQGVSGTFRGMENIVGLTYSDKAHNWGNSGSAGFEIGGTKDIKGGMDATGVTSNTVSSAWQQNNGFLSNYRNNPEVYSYLDYNPVNFEPLVYKMHGEITPESSFDFIKKTGTYNPVRLENNVWGTETSLNSKYVDAINTINSENDLWKEDYKIKRNNRLIRNQYIHALNAYDAGIFGLNKKIKVYNPDYDRCNNPLSLEEYKEIDRCLEPAKRHHLSEIRIDKQDGSKYVYGIPAYVTKQVESSFSVKHVDVQNDKALTIFDPADDSKGNTQGKDGYYQKTILPPYAHSYLLTAVLSPEYIDRTANGPTDDDLGNYVKFNYRNIRIEKNKTYKWRTPSEKITDDNNQDHPSVSYNEGFLNTKRDSRGSYVYGEKELWYIHSIETKNYIVEFQLSDRLDGFGVQNYIGDIDFNNKQVKKINSITLYSKKDRIDNGNNAVPIKTVHFIYDYSLCKGVPNNFINGQRDETELSNEGGKLTLKKIYFTYGFSGKGKISPYEFKYCYNNDPSISQSQVNPYNPDYHIKGYDSWGFYKPSKNNQLGNELFSYKFPYVDQRTINQYNQINTLGNIIPGTDYISDVYSAAWNLTGIKLPSGANINVTYESDDYAYVQNQRAMQMTKLLGFSDANHNEPTNSLYDDDPYNILYFKLPKAFNSTQLNSFFGDQDELYFKAKVRIKDDSNNGGIWENISGYASISREKSKYGLVINNSRIAANIISANTSDIAWVAVKDFDLDEEDYNPVSVTAMRFCLANEPSFINGKGPLSDKPDIDPEFFLKLNPISLIGELIDAFRSPWNLAKKNDIANSFDPSESWVRIQNPYFCKKGGGSRVKKIVISDNWSSGQKTYGQEYEYTTEAPDGVDLTESPDGVDLTENKMSSGVAAYEPQVGGDENPLHKPFYYKTADGDFHPDNWSFIETPIGEVFYPAPTVGYSKVTIKTIYEDGVIINKRHKDGVTVNEFYTAKDFPVKAEVTPINEVNAKSNWFEDNFSSYSYNKVAVSQGFVITNNDMHGKPKSVKNYSQLDLKAPVSGQDYIYELAEGNNLDYPNKRLSGRDLNNYVDVLNKNAVKEKNFLGIDYEMYHDFRECKTNVTNTGCEINITFFTLGAIPLIIPPIWPKYSENDVEFRSSATTKVITTYGLLKEIVKYDQSSKVKTSNLLYDAETGDVLLTKTQNAFNDETYSFKYPAHWAYDGMGQAYKNTNLVIRDFSFENDVYTKTLGNNKTLQDYFVPGDEVIIYQRQNANSPLTNSTTLNKNGWVLYVKPDKISIVDHLGKKVEPVGNYTLFDIRVINSGRKNQASEAIGSIVSRKDPTAYLLNDVNNPMVNAGILHSEAVEYDNTRKIYSESFNSKCELRPTQSMSDLLYFLNDLISQNKLINNIGTVSGTNTIPNNLSLTTDLFNVNINNYSSFSSLLRSYVLNNSYNLTTDWVGCVENMNSSEIWVGFRNTNNKLIPWLYFGDDSQNTPIKIKDIKRIVYIKPYEWEPPCTNEIPRIKMGIEYCSANLNSFQSILPPNPNPTSETICNNISFKEIVASVGFLPQSSIILPMEPYTYYSNECGSNTNEATINPFISGVMGNWYPRTSYKYLTERKKVVSTTGNESESNLRSDGDYKDFVRFWQYNDNNGKWEKPINLSGNWKSTNTITIKDNLGNEVENKNPLEIYSAALFGYYGKLPIAVANNATHREIASENFEERPYDEIICGGQPISYSPVDNCYKHFPLTGINISTKYAHSGKNSMEVTNLFESEDIPIGKSDPNMLTYKEINERLVNSPSNPNKAELKIADIPEQNLSKFSPQRPSAGTQYNEYLISYWLHKGENPNFDKMAGTPLLDLINNNNVLFTRESVSEPIEGWQKVTWIMKISANSANSMKLKFQINVPSGSPEKVYIDDFRITPLRSSMKSFVYDDISKRFVAELDENNYATFYEYDEDGALVRVKKETEKGVFTIKEVRKSLKK